MDCEVTNRVFTSSTVDLWGRSVLVDTTFFLPRIEAMTYR